MCYEFTCAEAATANALWRGRIWHLERSHLLGLSVLVENGVSCLPCAEPGTFPSALEDYLMACAKKKEKHSQLTYLFVISRKGLRFDICFLRQFGFKQRQLSAVSMDSASGP